VRTSLDLLIYTSRPGKKRQRGEDRTNNVKGSRGVGGGVCSGGEDTLGDSCNYKLKRTCQAESGGLLIVNVMLQGAFRDSVNIEFEIVRRNREARPE
jgi:hypothetical protein